MPNTTRIEDFWCCLPEPEKTAWEACGTGFILTGTFVLADVIDLIFAPVDAGVSRKRLAIFVYVAQLTETIIVIDEIEVRVYVFGADVVPQYSDFWDAGDYDCECPCEILRFPNPC